MANLVKMDQLEDQDQTENLGNLVRREFLDHRDKVDDVDPLEIEVKWVLLVILVLSVILVTLDLLELVLRHKNITKNIKQS